MCECHVYCSKCKKTLVASKQSKYAHKKLCPQPEFSKASAEQCAATTKYHFQRKQNAVAEVAPNAVDNAPQFQTKDAVTQTEIVVREEGTLTEHKKADAETQTESKHMDERNTQTDHECFFEAQEVESLDSDCPKDLFKKVTRNRMRQVKFAKKALQTTTKEKNILSMFRK